MITGANSGLGKCAAIAIAKKGQNNSLNMIIMIRYLIMLFMGMWKALFSKECPTFLGTP